MTETHLREISLTSMKVTAVAPSLVMTTDSHHNSLRGQQRMDRSSPWPLLPNQTSPCWVRVSDVRTGHSHKSWCWHFGSHTTPYLWWRNSNTLSILITIIPVQRPKKRMKKKKCLCLCDINSLFWSEFTDDTDYSFHVILKSADISIYYLTFYKLLSYLHVNEQKLST